MKLERDVGLEKVVNQKFRSFIKKRNDGRIHVSDLIYCLRKAYFRRVNDVQPNFKSREIFFSGKYVHEYIQNGFPEYRHEVEFVKNGIVGTIDMLNKVPIEIKTTRMWVILKTNLRKVWIEQLKAYCWLTDSQVGYLMVYSLTSAHMNVFRFVFSEEELKEFGEWLLSRKRLLEQALKYYKYDMLSMSRFSWECRYCEFYQICYGDER